MDVKLLPCPFCGAPAELAHDVQTGTYCVRCHHGYDCFLNVFCEEGAAWYADIIVEFWNRRRLGKSGESDGR